MKVTPLRLCLWRTGRSLVHSRWSLAALLYRLPAMRLDYFTLWCLNCCFQAFFFCFFRVLQDMENPQITLCNKGDQHYRSSPSNQSSSSDPGPCGSSGWSQQPGYDGYRTAAVLTVLQCPSEICELPVMNSAPISRGTIPDGLFCKVTDFFPPKRKTASHVEFPSFFCLK